MAAPSAPARLVGADAGWLVVLLVRCVWVRTVVEGEGSEEKIMHDLTDQPCGYDASRSPDYDAIERAAKAATPGPWRVQTHHDIPENKTLMGVPVVRAPWPDLPHGSITVARCGNGNAGTYSGRPTHIREREEGNARYIALLDPATVLALVARARRATELELGMLARDSHDDWRKDKEPLSDH